MNKKVQVWVRFKEEVLLLKVIEKRGAGWHPVTGSVEKNESWIDGAKRETLEETGIPEEKGKFVSLEYSFEFEGRWGRAEEHAFAFLLKKKPEKITIDLGEHTDFKWIPIKKAKDLVEHDSQKAALEKLECMDLKI